MAKPGPAAKGLKLDAFPMEFGRVFNLGKLKEISVLYLLYKATDAVYGYFHHIVMKSECIIYYFLGCV